VILIRRRDADETSPELENNPRLVPESLALSGNGIEPSNTVTEVRRRVVRKMPANGFCHWPAG